MHLPALLLGVRQISDPRMNHHPLHKHAHTCIFTLLFFIKILYDKVWPPPLSVTELSFCRCLSLWSLCVYPVPKEMKTCIWGLTTPCSPPKNKLKEKTSGSLFHRLLVKGEFTACLEGWQMGNWTLHVGVGRGRPAALRGCRSRTVSRAPPTDRLVSMRKLPHGLHYPRSTSYGYALAFIIDKKGSSRVWGWPSLLGKDWAKGDLQGHLLRFQSLFMLVVNMVDVIKQRSMKSD